MEKYLYKSNTSKDGYNLAMAYPACEAFAMSSLGYLWLYKLADEMDGIRPSRIYTDSKIFSDYAEAFAFSLSFDFDFMGVFEILEKYKLSLISNERSAANLK